MSLLRLSLLFTFALNLFSFHVLAAEPIQDVIIMKNGDVFRGTILVQKMGQYIQLLLQDLNEKRLNWKDVDSIEHIKSISEEKSDVKVSTPLVQSTPAPKVPSSPTVEDDVLEQTKFNFDIPIAAFEYTRSNYTLKSDASTLTYIFKDSERKVQTVPAAFGLGMYFKKTFFQITDFRKWFKQSGGYRRSLFIIAKFLYRIGL